jgi:diguanylate cyclase (GGDEF)-like protein
MTDDDNDGSLDRDERFEALERLAATDPLTGLMNRRGCEKSIAAEMARAERERTPLSCIVLDIDQLKDVNETYGYLAGDRVLREISALLHRTVRPSDVLARWAGDEFLVMLPGVDLEQARRVAARIKHAVKMHEIAGIRSVTVTGGVSTIDTDFYFNGMLAQAYRRLNQAKRTGEGDSDPHVGVREPRNRGPEGTGRSSAATVDEPEPERRVDAIERARPLPRVG